jgi:hypothetical protein
VRDFWEARLGESHDGYSRPVRPADYLYSLDCAWTDVFTGTIRGAPVLVGPYEGPLVACLFGPDGALRGVERRAQKAEPTPDPARDALYLDILREAARDPLHPPPRCLEALAWYNRPVRLAWEWAEEMGVAFGPIRVQRFALPGKRIGIEAGNRLYEGREPEAGGGTLEGWLAGGCFVFWWSRDLWVGEDGRVFAT